MFVLFAVAVMLVDVEAGRRIGNSVQGAGLCRVQREWAFCRHALGKLEIVSEARSKHGAGGIPGFFCFAACAGCMVKNAWGSPPVKEVVHMEQFLLDMAAQVAAGVIVALFVYWLNRR